MGVLKKSIAFYCCTNGLGHYKRVYEVSKHLTAFYAITIYCTESQINKIGKIPNVNYVIYTIDNIRWDFVTKGKKQDAIELYLAWGEVYSKTVHDFDLVVSDNLPILLNNRSDIVLMGSFLWKDVFQDYIGNNTLTSTDSELLNRYNPPIITNRYLETQSVKIYPNKIQFGFGCDNRVLELTEIKHTILQSPSLPYLQAYDDYLNNLEGKFKFDFTRNLSYITSTRIVARPGVGTITHCVEYGIPLIALYSEDDSKEIVELASIVEELKIGFKQNIKESFDIYKLKRLSSNINFHYTQKFDKQGYEKTAEYLKKWIE